MHLQRILKYILWLPCCLVLVMCNKNTSEPGVRRESFVIENLGVRFGPYDPVTNNAGDFYFTKDFIKVFGEFGSQTRDPDWNIKELPHFTYIIQNDAIIVSISEGEVVRIYYQEDSDDYDFSIRSLNDPAYDIVYDHLVNLQIRLGDIVLPGDTLGNPSPLVSGLGIVEIMINNLETGRSYCPFCCFKEETQDIYIQKIEQLMSDWETFKDDTSIYDEKNHVIPGCRYESMVTY
jgi:hypothetical protein